MAARKEQYIIVKNEAGEILGLYIAKTPQQALAEHVKPLVAKAISIDEAGELMFGDAGTGLRPVRCAKVGQ